MILDIRHIYNFAASNDISGLAVDRVVRFCTRVDYITYSLRMTNHPQLGRGQGHVTHFSIQCPHSDFIEFICAIRKTLMYVCMYVIISRMAEVTVAKFYLQIEYIK